MNNISLPIATVVIILIQLAGGVWFGANIASRVNYIEDRLAGVEILPPGSALRLVEMSERLARIETKLEILMEGQRKWKPVDSQSHGWMKLGTILNRRCGRVCLRRLRTETRVGNPVSGLPEKLRC
jgi:hypothetical protein